MSQMKNLTMMNNKKSYENESFVKWNWSTLFMGFWFYLKEKKYKVESNNLNKQWIVFNNTIYY